MRVVRQPELPAALVVVRPKDGGDVMVVVGGGLPVAAVRNLTRVLLSKRERVELLCALRSRT
jgi:hypothetical protein